MSLFGLPRCPHCGGKTEQTFYAFPYPQLRCPNCIKNNREKKEMEKRIKKLERLIGKDQGDAAGNQK